VKPRNGTGALASERLVGSVSTSKSKIWALAYARSNYASIFLNPSMTNDIKEKDMVHLVVNKLLEKGIVEQNDVFIGRHLQDTLGATNDLSIPHLLAIAIAASPWSFQGKPRLGATVETTETVGIHDLSGCLMVWGQKVKPGFHIESASVFDIAPTALYAYDLPVNSDFDGRPLSEMFTFKRPIKVYDKITGVVWEKTEKKQSDIIRKKLDKLLGN
jgi:hypothetical protein